MILPGRSVAEREWVSLQEFGYDLKEPGTYAVAGFPRMAEPQRNLRVQLDRSLVKNSEVAFSVSR